MTEVQAIEVLKAAGYRITKPRKPTTARRTLNALGKPYGANFDPKYRMKHRTPRPSYGLSTAAGRSARYAYRALMTAKHGGDETLLKEIFARQCVA